MQRANISIEEALVTVISTLLSGFPASATTDKMAQLRAYMMAIEGIPFDAVDRAATAYIRGRVADHNSDFAPSCAAFADQCRTQAAIIEAAARKPIAAPEPKDEGPKVEPWKMQLLARHLMGDQTATAQLKSMFPANEIIAMADTPVQQLDEAAQ
jgi:hypothetical protein